MNVRDCTCYGQQTCYSCRHLALHEKLPTGYKQWPPFNVCHRSARLGVNSVTGLQWGGCKDCWSKTIYRWCCSLCNYKSDWIEDGYAYENERTKFRDHHQTAWAA